MESSEFENNNNIVQNEESSSNNIPQVQVQEEPIQPKKTKKKKDVDVLN